MEEKVFFEGNYVFADDPDSWVEVTEDNEIFCHSASGECLPCCYPYVDDACAGCPLLQM